MSYRRGLAGGLAAAMVLFGLRTGAAEEAAPPKNLQDLDQRLAAVFEQEKIPGASVALVENGEIVFAKGYGFADKATQRPATADTPFRAGSISKGVTAIAVMTLVEQGKLSLDAPLATLLPDVHFTNPWESTDPVRLVNLIEHTTGWPDIGPRVLARDEADWSVEQGVQFSSPDFVSRWQPGRFMSYNNAGPAVAALAIEKVSGDSFDDYARDAVLRPMGMATADFALPADLAAKIAKSYNEDGAVTPYQHIVLKPAGSLTVSARELAQLVRFYLGRGTVDGHQILSPQSVDRIERGESNLGTKVGFANSYGLGNSLLPDKGVGFRGHNGSIDSFTSVLGYSDRTKSGYVLMANGGDGVDFAKPAAQLVQAYLTRGVPLDPPPVVAIDPAELQSYAGYYRVVTTPNALLRPYSELLNIAHVSAAGDRLKIGGRDFLPIGQHRFRRDDRDAASMAFVEENGKIYKVGVFSTQVKEALWRVAAIWLTGLLLGLGLVIGLVMLIPWIVSAARGRLASRGGLALRLVPLAGLVALAVTAALPFLTFMGSSTAVLQLAEIGPYSLTILACSLAYPLLGLVGMIRTKAAGRFVRAYAGLSSLALLTMATYAAAIGWFALRTWAM